MGAQTNKLFPRVRDRISYTFERASLVDLNQELTEARIRPQLLVVSQWKRGKKIMRRITQIVCLSILVLFSAGAYAQSAAEKEAIGAIEKYWQARNDQDFETQTALTSDKGTLDA
ncbi:MAG: hypothetical protein GY949_13240, partial [Gammaproteobacteria bacterium]|nr:hypothetical protein [Gammaproteobacteria bacterium]